MMKKAKKLLSVSEAMQRILAALAPVGVERLPIERVAGRVLAETIVAPLDIPPFDNSSMDGFALRSVDVAAASLELPIILDVVADITAGENSDVVLQTGQAARIVTGAVIPEGADAVIPVEDTNLRRFDPGSGVPKLVRIYWAVKRGDYLRPRGQDIQAGELILTPNRRLRPQDVGLLAMQGIAEVAVYRRPKVGLLSTGNELLPVGAPLEPGKIYEANAYTLGALINQNGCEYIHLGTSPDEVDAVRACLDSAIRNHVDLILSSAGVSMGAFDFVRAVVEQNGELGFWRVNMRPGKPLTFGNYQGVPFIGLPGNPVSAFMGFEVFVLPALGRLAGLPEVPRVSQTVRLLETVESDGRESYLRAIVSRRDDQWVARLTGHQGSGNLLSLVQANALLIIPSGVKSLPEGAEVQAWLL